MERTTSLVDEEILLQGAKTPEFASTNLQSRLNTWLERALSLNIRFSPAQSELMHMLPRGSHLGVNTNKGVKLYENNIITKDTIKELGVWIDHRLSFRIHAQLPA
ncbi:hypothetical protein Q9L58_010061 [Maublancomyces gigas]|uniref:Uncharacterized protein n=1 Tax=Discina gigas TaxID=1032678 RepID=A0ABR3G563_9PEZI